MIIELELPRDSLLSIFTLGLFIILTDIIQIYNNKIFEITSPNLGLLCGTHFGNPWTRLQKATISNNDN